MAIIDLANITEITVEDIVKSFLYVWGRMGRVLGQINFLGWQAKVAEIIKSNSGIHLCRSACCAKKPLCGSRVSSDILVTKQVVSFVCRLYLRCRPYLSIVVRSYQLPVVVAVAEGGV